jgi:hypothetical protein
MLEADLLAQYCPVLKLDGNEGVAPCSLEDYVKGSALYENKYDSRVASAGQYELADHLNDPSLYMKYELAIPKPSSMQVSANVPVYGKAELVNEGGQYRYSLLYMWVWPYKESFADAAIKANEHSCDVQHMRVMVDRGSGNIDRVFYCGYGNQGAWLRPQQLEFDGNNRHRVVAYAARGTHSLWPRAGVAWRVSGMHSDVADGKGAVWKHSQVESLPQDVATFAGQLADGVPTPTQQPWYKQDTQQLQTDMLTRIVKFRQRRMSSSSSH